MRLFSTLLLALWVPFVHAASLTIDLHEGSRTWSREALLALPQVRSIHIADDVAYKRDMDYRAIPLAVLLPGIEAGDHLQIVALDGFAAELPAAPLLSSQGAQAWLAIEEEHSPWPALAAGKPGAGPFYLVWKNPEAGQIGPEQWPFQVAKIRQLSTVEERFPALLPASAAGDEVRAGFTQFQKNCLACHRLNGAGDSQFGPDLNLPYNPTEYFAAPYLRQYIRDPQSLRHWPQARMPGFSRQVLSDPQLEQILAYLGHMATRKQPPAQSQ